MSKNYRFIITLQRADGVSPPFSFDITGSKAHRVVEVIKDDINKKRRKMETATATLENFFNDDN